MKCRHGEFELQLGHVSDSKICTALHFYSEPEFMNEIIYTWSINKLVVSLDMSP